MTTDPTTRLPQTHPSASTPTVPSIAHNGLTAEQVEVLASPIRRNRVRRKDEGRRGSFSYLEAWEIRAHLIRLFGFLGFDLVAEEIETLQLREVPPEREGDSTKWYAAVRAAVRLTVRTPDRVDETGRVIPGTTATYREYAVAGPYADRGAATPAIALDFATKTAVSDAIKRCAINLGTQFGLSLYNDGSLNDVVRMLFVDGQVVAVQPTDDVQAKLDSTPDVVGGELDGFEEQA